MPEVQRSKSPGDVKTILVLDDDPEFHKLIVPVITSRGHRVLSSHNGEEARQILAADAAIHLVIVDGQLPDVNGIDWIAAVRACGFQPLILFVSAYWRDAQSYHKLTKELGVSLVLHKPIIASVFATEIDILLGRSSAIVESARQDVADTLLALRADYAKELPQRLSELRDLLVRLTAQPGNHTIAAQAREVAHKLRGTAASYGFREIGELSANIEESIVELAQEPADSSEVVEKTNLSLRRAEQLAELAASSTADEMARTDLPESRADDSGEFAPVACILGVDDDAAFLDLVDAVARVNQLAVVRASNGAEALELACMREVHAALIDVELGSQDSAFKLAGDLRLLPGYEDLPLAFLSGAGHIEQVVEVESLGQCMIVHRPTKPDALAAAVRQLFAIRQASRPRVLLVDDDQDFLKRMSFVLGHEGLTVRTVSETMGILEEMQNFPPDVVLLDVMMPGVSGFDLCRMIRTMPRWRALPVFFLTAYSDLDTRLACLRSGADDCLVKPVVNEELLLRIRLGLNRARTLRDRLERDSVSGLWQRRPLMNQLCAMLSEARRHNWAVSICLVEVLNQIPAAQNSLPDSLLAMLADVLNKRLLAENLKGHWGGNRLVLAFRAEDRASVELSMRKIADEFLALQNGLRADVPTVAEMRYSVVCYPDDGVPIHQLFIAAFRRLKESQPLSAGSAVG